MCLAIPGKITRLMESEGPMGRMAKVDFNGITKDIRLDFVPEAAEGDYVLVHVGVAISTVDEAEAKEMAKLLEELGEMDEIDPPETQEERTP